jgi:uncharacterized protein
MAARLTAGPVDAAKSPAATLKTLDARAVAIDGGVWARRQAVNGEGALPHGFRMLEAAGNLENLRIAAGCSAGRYRGPVFMDSDVYKWLEAAACEMARAPNDWLRSTSEATIALVAAAQGDDGYVNSHYMVAEPGKRWTDFAQGHELYCAGHLIQAAIAHRRATGDDRLLTIARRFADHIHTMFGPGRRVATPGHPEIEMALAELYRETGERRHLDLAAFFLEHRGRGWLGPGRYNSSVSYQDRVPVRDATTVEGHAVRAMYLATGVADVYLETGEAALLEALTRQWYDMVGGKLYVTGGVGARHLAEAFGQPYELPNDLAYCETCGAIGSVMWNWRMLLATGQSRFADLIERTLYNAVLAGVSLTGDRYFYVNPLANNGEVEQLSRGGCLRREWHLVACCPPNVMRLLASLGHYVATRDASGLQIHQYGSARIATPSRLGQASPSEWRARTPGPGGFGSRSRRRTRCRGRSRCACPAGARGRRPGSTAGKPRARLRPRATCASSARGRAATPWSSTCRWRRDSWRRIRGSSPRADAWPSSEVRSSIASSRPITRRPGSRTSKSTQLRHSRRRGSRIAWMA